MRFLTIFALTSLVIASCGAPQSADEEASYTEAAQVAYDEAERAFSRRDYETARHRFTNVYNEFPYSQYSALSEFRIGDTFLRERTYARAIEAFRRFSRIHPTHPLVPEAEYKIALAYVNQMPGDWFARPPSHERDLTDTENAHQALRLFLANYGDSDFAEDAQNHLTETTDRLASYELYTAEFYTRRENPRAAALRAEYLVENYPNATQVPEALFLHGRALIELGDVDQATTSLRRLVDEFPGHPLSQQATDWLAAI